MGEPEFVFSNDGTRIAFEKSGAGPALVIVNGALSERSSVASWRPSLDPHFTVFAYDRRGRGDSEDTPPYSPEREIEDLAAVLGATGGPAFVFGQSSGGILALRAAASGLRIRRLAVNEPPFILPGTRPPIDPGVPGRMRQLSAAGDREGMLRAFLIDQVGMPASAVDAMKQRPTWGPMMAMAPTTLYDTIVADPELPRALLSGLGTRTLVTHGGAGHAWLTETARAVAAALPNAEIATLEGQGHHPGAEVLAPVLVRFFSAPGD